jgi:PAS domain S-box-containing protein
MQHTSRKWLWRFEIILCIYHALLVIFIGSQMILKPSVTSTNNQQYNKTNQNVQPEAEATRNTNRTASSWSSFAIIALSILLMVYVLIFMQRQLDIYPDLPHIVIVCLSGAIIALATQVDNNTYTIIYISYIIFMFFAALASVIPVITTTILTFLALIISTYGNTSNHAMGDVNAHIIEMLYVVGGMVSGLAGWLLFKRYYMMPNNINTLSQLLDQEKLKSNVILESIDDGVMVMNIKGTVEIMNNSAAELLGWSREEAIKLDYRSLIQLTHDNDTEKQPELSSIDICMQTNKASQKISLLETKNKRRVYIDIVTSPITENYKTEDGSSTTRTVGIIAVLRNVDKQKREEEQRSDFISTASHEMRTPIASIQGFIELASNPKVSTIDAKAKDYLAKAHEATVHLGTLFQDLLTVARSEDGRLANHPTVIDISSLLQTLAEQNTMSATKKGLRLVLETNSNDGGNKTISPLLYVYVDQERLRELVSNLIENAIKYTPSGLITVGASMKERSVVIRVSDTGIGIAEEDIPHLFQKFYRTDNTATRAIGGNGLGLYICKQLTEMLGGKIWVESTLGAGSTFYVELPRIAPEQVEALKQQAEMNKALAVTPTVTTSQNDIMNNTMTQ